MKTLLSQRRKKYAIISFAIIICIVSLFTVIVKKKKIVAAAYNNPKASSQNIELEDDIEIIPDELFVQEEEEEKPPTEEEEEESKKNVSSDTKYYIKVNYQANVVTIYQRGEGDTLNPIKAMTCSTGTATPRSGVYSVQGKWTWGALFGGVWGHYVTKIVGNILFHSVPYLSNDPGSLEYWEYDKLGTSASAGCVRLSVADAAWIFNNMPSGTPVEFYGSSDPGPLGKPGTQKISNNVECRDWDPTDPDSRNPWRNYKEPEEPKIEETNNQPEQEKTNNQSSNTSTNTTNNTNTDQNTSNKADENTENVNDGKEEENTIEDSNEQDENNTVEDNKENQEENASSEDEKTENQEGLNPEE